MTDIRDQQCFTISEVAADWNELIMPNTHRRHRRNATVESRRVGGVYTIRN